MAVIVKGVTSGGGGAKIATILNDDGTQKLIISDKDSVIDLTPLDSEINEQTDLIAQIQAELDAKAEGGGGSGGIEVSGEIEITENGVHDVAQYATANVNVQSAPVLLWTNASPTSGFDAQTVTLASGYSSYIVEVNYSVGVQTQKGYGLVYPTSVLQGVAVSYPNISTIYVRQINSVSDGAINFGRVPSGSYDFAIPARIWGVKFTL